jgi:hypothetical protein
MTRTFAALFFLLVPAVASPQLKPSMVVIPQPGAPLRIEQLTALHRPETSSTQFSRGQLEGIEFGVKMQNTGTQRIVAYRLGFVAFNAFNEYMFRFGGYGVDNVEPGQAEAATWRSTRSNASIFNTAVAYVDRVRFSNGEVWSADLKVVSDRLRQIEADFDVSVLKGDPSK